MRSVRIFGSIYEKEHGEISDQSVHVVSGDYSASRGTMQILCQLHTEGSLLVFLPYGHCRNERCLSVFLWHYHGSKVYQICVSQVEPQQDMGRVPWGGRAHPYLQLLLPSVAE